MDKAIKYKIPVMILVILSLITGIFTGWYRLGLSLPVSKVFLHHGAIMVGSFLGTVILMERIVALKRKWLYLFPFINGLSIVFYFIGYPYVSFACLVIGAFGLCVVFYLINEINSDLPHQLMWAGAATWLIGNIFLLTYSSYAQSILWWMGFLLLTIAAERLELNRFLPVPGYIKKLLVVVLLLFPVACIIPFHLGGRYLAGATLMLTSLWLLRYDMIWKSIKKSGIHHYSALTLVFGYFWLFVSGFLFLLEGTGWIPYDSLMHSFFIGFVFSMIFAHAPIILPGVLGLNGRPFHASLYVWSILLQVTLGIRLIGGLVEVFLLRQWGGVLNGVVILCFILNLAAIVFRNRLKK